MAADSNLKEDLLRKMCNVVEQGDCRYQNNFLVVIRIYQNNGAG